MFVPEKNRLKWLKNLDRGDKGKLVEKCNTSFQTIKNALEGEATPEMIISIDSYFKEKLANLEKSLK